MHHPLPEQKGLRYREGFIRRAAAALVVVLGVAGVWALFRPAPDAAAEPAEKRPAALPAATAAPVPIVRGKTRPSTIPPAVESAWERPPSVEAREALAAAAADWAVQNPSAAEAWARALLDPQTRARVLTAIALAIAEADAPRAITLTQAAGLAGEERDRALAAIAQRWVQYDAQAAAAWVASQPEGKMRSDSFREVVKLWSIADAEPVSRWLEGLPRGSLRDEGIAALVSSLAVDAPETALAWLPRIADPDLRSRAAEAIKALHDPAPPP